MKTRDIYITVCSVSETGNFSGVKLTPFGSKKIWLNYRYLMYLKFVYSQRRKTPEGTTRSRSTSSSENSGSGSDLTSRYYFKRVSDSISPLEPPFLDFPIPSPIVNSLLNLKCVLTVSHLFTVNSLDTEKVGCLWVSPSFLLLLSIYLSKRVSVLWRTGSTPSRNLRSSGDGPRWVLTFPCGSGKVKTSW